MNNQALIIIAVVVGALLSLQGVANSNLSKYLNHPLQASFISFLVALIFLKTCLTVSNIGFPSVNALKTLPWYLYAGGFLGVIFVTSVLTLMPKLGVANVVVSIFVGQMFFSVIVDHFGLFGMPVKPLDWVRGGGGALLLTGLYFIQS